MGLTTHMMLMVLLFPSFLSKFYSTLLEFVTFDMIPTDEIYSEILDLENSPFSEEAEKIGYESRYILWNSGSIPLYFLIGLVLQVFLKILRMILSRCRGKVYSLASRWQAKFFWVDLHQMFDSAYLILVFCTGFNFWSLKFRSASEIFNNGLACIVAFLIIFIPLFISVRLVKGFRPFKVRR